jgi:hypothetical protein
MKSMTVGWQAHGWPPRQWQIQHRRLPTPPAAATAWHSHPRTAGVDSLQQRRALLLSPFPQLEADEAKLGGRTSRQLGPAVGQQQLLKRTLAVQPAQGRRQCGGAAARGLLAGQTRLCTTELRLKKQGRPMHRQG